MVDLVALFNKEGIESDYYSDESPIGGGFYKTDFLDEVDLEYILGGVVEDTRDVEDLEDRDKYSRMGDLIKWSEDLPIEEGEGDESTYEEDDMPLGGGTNMSDLITTNEYSDDVGTIDQVSELSDLDFFSKHKDLISSLLES